MYTPTTNPYRFQYLITGIKGEGIKEVYLPEEPPDDQVLFKEEQKWVKPAMPEHLKKAARDWILKSDPDDKDNYDPDFISPYAKELYEWEEREWKRTEDGVWFWNDGVKTYITRFYYFYLSAWDPGFDIEYRETDKEITYWIQFWEEDPNSFGGLLNTIRRYGKSALMGAWIIFRTIRNFRHRAGMQGENDDKIWAFYDQHVLKPFEKLPYYFLPRYDTDSKNSSYIKFEIPKKRGRKFNILDQTEVLESFVDYRVSKEQAYDQAKLDSYAGEELGKTLVANVNKRWGFVKPCLKRGKFIRGKHFGATTVEFMDTSGKGGKAYKKLAYESDYNQRNALGQTKSGLYFAFLPGDCALEGFFDEHGRPKRKEMREWILAERADWEDDPEEYSAIIRKYPLTIGEIFYINTQRCEFNAKILQDRKMELSASVEPIFSRYDLYWENNKRFSRVLFRHNPVSGWFKATWLPKDLQKEANLVETKFFGGKPHYFPRNDSRFASGIDPIDHGVVIEDKSSSDDEFISAKRSRPVLLIKSKYDSNIDGMLTQELLEQRAKDRYQYKTNRYFGMMDVRPTDPNVLFERALMVCWFFGVSLHVENQKYSIINYFHNNNCGGFIMNKYEPDWVKKKAQQPHTEGTPASQTIIQDYTSHIATYVEYFGHTIPFEDLVEDLLMFKPKKTTEHDYSVSMGFTELAGVMKPKHQQRPILDLNTILPIFNAHTGELLN